MTTPPTPEKQSEAQRALDEIEASLDYLRAPTANMPWEAAHLAKAFSLLPTLRAALAPAADDEVGAIRGRHEAIDYDIAEDHHDWEDFNAQTMHNDRATLLSHVDRLSAELSAERGRRVEVEGALRDSIPPEIVEVAVRVGLGRHRRWGRQRFVRHVVGMCVCQHRRPGMFDLTTSIETNRRAKLVRAIKEAAKLIQDCPDPQKQWRAMAELRKLQARLKNPVL